jgi:hypothetical protein
MNAVKASGEYTRGVLDIQPLFCLFLETIEFLALVTGLATPGRFWKPGKLFEW